VNLHEAGILHRDLKPSNILVDNKGLGWLTDFGLARSDRPDPADTSRRAMGTFGFMSPEQWAGELNITAGADVFSMGVTIYQALTLEFPYGRGPIDEARPPVRIPARVSRSWPRNLDLVLQKALEPDRVRRYKSAAGLRDDWQRSRKGLLPQQAQVSSVRRFRDRMRRWAIPAVAAASLFATAAMLVIFMTPPRRVFRTVAVITEPPAARVALVPLSEADGTPQFNQAVQPIEKTPETIAKMSPGDYLVIAEVPGHGFHEVFRRVPAPGEKPEIHLPGRSADGEKLSERGPRPPPGKEQPFLRHRMFEERDGIIYMPLISVPKSENTATMSYFAGGEFTMGCDDCCQGSVPAHKVRVGPFYLDTTEVTVAQYRAVRGALPSELQRLSPKDDEAVRFVTYDQAVQCAEQMGKRLADEAEFEYAATVAGANRFPWGNDLAKIKAWKFGAVRSTDYDRTATHPPVFGLYSNVAEWTSSWRIPYPGQKYSSAMLARARDYRIVRGGPFPVIAGNASAPDLSRQSLWDAHFREGIKCEDAFSGLGFRCARSHKPRFPGPKDG
jgi:formylglycine-generating enzyme required for sulfatase activity